MKKSLIPAHKGWIKKSLSCNANHEVGSLKKLHEIFDDETDLDEFARINLEKYQSDYGQFIGDLLNDQGSIFSLERLGDMADPAPLEVGPRIF